MQRSNNDGSRLLAEDSRFAATEEGERGEDIEVSQQANLLAVGLPARVQLRPLLYFPRDSDHTKCDCPYMECIKLCIRSVICTENYLPSDDCVINDELMIMQITIHFGKDKIVC